MSHNFETLTASPHQIIWSMINQLGLQVYRIKNAELKNLAAAVTPNYPLFWINKQNPATFPSPRHSKKHSVRERGAATNFQMAPK
jgi:hypothetical protein